MIKQRSCALSIKSISFSGYVRMSGSFAQLTETEATASKAARVDTAPADIYGHSFGPCLCACDSDNTLTQTRR